MTTVPVDLPVRVDLRVDLYFAIPVYSGGVLLLQFDSTA